MPYRNIVFANNEIYHTINRGVAGENIFLNKRDYSRFFDCINFYKHGPALSFSHYSQLPKEEKEKFAAELKSKSDSMVEILAYCFMPNHFHFILRQLRDNGIKTFMSNLQNSYARYFNIKNERDGSLFRAMFKAIRVETEEQLAHLSRYIHLNPSSAYLVDTKKLKTYIWSSFPEYISKREAKLSNPEFVLNLDYFKGDSELYKNFTLNHADYQRELQKIKKLVLEKKL